ncbi:hypothetical protein F52700_8212 [Fusarium sp. NRRL 52700]|nr:hypothetical protein F52700_8212 [Fusarium sp. NRRL 52700]
MSGFPRANHRYKRKKSKGRRGGRSRTRRSRRPTKGQARETPCVRCISRMADDGHEHVCFSQASTSASACYDCARMRSSCELPVGQAVELGQQLQNFALHIVDSHSADERATQVEWLQRADAAKEFLATMQETPSVAPDQGSQSVSEELEPAPSGNMPPVNSMQPSSTVPTHSIQSGQHYMAPPQGMSVPEADGIMNPQGHPFQGISHRGPGPHNNQAQFLVSRLESTLNRVAAGFEANNRLIQQILAQDDQNTNAPVHFNR